MGSGGTTTDSPVAKRAAPGVASGSPARRFACVARAPSPACCSPFSKRSACSAVSQRPSFVMPMGTTSYLVLSIAFTTDAAESRETSCSPLRPPKRMPTRIFVVDMLIQVWRSMRFPSMSGVVTEVQKQPQRTLTTKDTKEHEGKVTKKTFGGCQTSFLISHY